MLIKHSLLFFTTILTLFRLFFCRELMKEPDEFRKHDIKITKFLKDPNKEGWEENLKEIQYFIDSMKNMIMVLNGTLPGLTKEFLGKVEEFHKNEKPIFIDTNVVEYELQPVIKVSDEDFTRLCWLRIYAEKDWELLDGMLKSNQAAANP